MRSVEVPAFGMTARSSPSALSQDPRGRRSPKSLLERLMFSCLFSSPVGYSRRPRRTGVTPKGRVDLSLLGLARIEPTLYLRIDPPAEPNDQ
ncbi:hypothetical protein U1Q18_022483, partial [Sarracenia purpurea var. burkii]